jgi:putative flippase GtrA
MVDWIKKSITNISAKGGIFVFLRAQLSSQLASFSDFVISIGLVTFFNLYYVYATFVGSVCGGIVNCIINYRWTFKVIGIKKRYIAIKYLIVWGCSIALNTSGTYLVTELLKKIVWITRFSEHLFEDGEFILAKIIVSLMVGFGWNYNMYRFFVYRDCGILRIFMGKKHTKNTKK